MKKIFNYSLKATLLLWLFTTSVQAFEQDTLIGATMFASKGNGTIFSLLPNGSDYKVNYTIPKAINPGGNPYGVPVVYNGKLYGTASNAPAIYEYDTLTKVYTAKYIFPNGDEAPLGNLIVYKNLLYGMTSAGGANDYGMIFSFDPLKTGSAGFTDLFDFDGGSNGASGVASLTEFNNKLYGMTRDAGANGVGIIFSFDPSITGVAAFKDLYDFDGVTAGAQSRNSFTVYNNLLYGLSATGGSAAAGIIFYIDPSAATITLTTVKEFTFYDGFLPYGSLLLWGNQFFSVTSGGGSSTSGVLFSFNPATLNYNELIDLNKPNIDDAPISLVSGKGKVFGATNDNSQPSTLFSYDPATNQFQHLNTSDSGEYIGNLVDTGNIIYGFAMAITSYLYSYNLTTNEFKILHDFPVQDSSGYHPNGDLTLYQGKLYGSTQESGMDGPGVIFSYDIQTNKYAVVFRFTDSLKYNRTPVIYNNRLYACNAVLNSFICSFDLNRGTGVHEYNFSADNGFDPSPTGNLVVSGDKLYGANYAGGKYFKGSLFSYDPQKKAYAKLYDLGDLTNNGNGNASLLNYHDTIFATFMSISSYGGSVMSFDPNVQNSLKILHQFHSSDTDGTAPVALVAYRPLQSQVINFASITKTYGDSDFVAGATSSDTTIPVTYKSDNNAVAIVTAGGRVHIVGAGNAHITASQAGNDYYYPAKDTTVTLTVNKAPLSITANDTVIIKGASIPSTFNITYKGFVYGEDSSVLPGKITATTTATQTSLPGKYPITLSGPDTAKNYIVTYHNGTLTISNGTPVITFGSDFPSQVIYGSAPLHPDATSTNGSTPVYSSSDAAVAVVYNDSLIKITGAGTVTITVSFASGDGFNAGSSTAALTVTPAPLTITADNQQRQYKAPDPAFTATYAGFVYNDNESSLTKPLTFSTTATQSSLPGTYDINVCCAASPDYTITYVKGTLTITGNQTITFNPFSVMTYGDAQFNPNATSSSGLQPTYTTSNPSVAVINGSLIKITGAGTAIITAIFPTSGDTLSTSASQLLTVQPKQLTISANDTSKVQGQPNPVFTASYNGFVNGDTYLSLTQQPQLTTTAITSSPVGSYPITISGAQSFNNNYSIGYVNGILSIVNARGLSFPAITNKTYGDADFNAGISSLTPEIITYTSSNTSVATISNGEIHITGAGTTIITATLPADQSYPTSTTLSQTLTVKPAALTVTADNQTKSYGQVNPPLTVHYNGFVNGDDTTIIISQPITATTVDNSTYPGQYPITVSGGSAGKNYTLQYTAGVFTVTPLSGSDANSLDVLQRSRSRLDVNLYLVNQEPVAIQLFDLNGRRLIADRPALYKGFNTYSINVGNLPTGTYIVKTIGKDWSLNQKIIIR